MTLSYHSLTDIESHSLALGAFQGASTGICKFFANVNYVKIDQNPFHNGYLSTSAMNSCFRNNDCRDTSLFRKVIFEHILHLVFFKTKYLFYPKYLKSFVVIVLRKIWTTNKYALHQFLGLKTINQVPLLHTHPFS